MTTEHTYDVHPGTTSGSFDAAVARDSEQRLDHERAVDGLLDDCFLSIGQGIGLRASLEFDAVLFLREHLRAKFLAAMRHFGNRWLEDRPNVTAVAWMLGERAVRYADGAPTIGVDAMRQATADVQRYCQLHAARRMRGRHNPTSEAATALIAGYWCTWDPEP